MSHQGPIGLVEPDNDPVPEPDQYALQSTVVDTAERPSQVPPRAAGSGSGRAGGSQAWAAADDDHHGQAYVGSPPLRSQRAAPRADREARVEDFETIDWTFYAEKERQYRKRMDRQMRGRPAVIRFLYTVYDSVQSWIALTLVGFVTGVVAAVVDIGADWASDLKFGYCKRGFWVNRMMCCKDSPSIMQCTSWRSWGGVAGGDDRGEVELGGYAFYVMVSVAMASYSALLVRSFAKYAAGSGIPEVKVILGGFVIRQFLSIWTLITKAVGLVMSVGSGLPLGKEGPYVHLACCIANLCSKYFSKFTNNEGKKRELLSGAAAAGVSVAFGAPVGGVLFSLEEVSSYFPPKTMWRSFFCAIVAAMTLQRLNPLHSGKLVMFEVTYHHQWKWFEIIPFVVLGAVGGVLGTIFLRINVRVARYRKTSRVGQYPIMEVAMLALGCSLVNYLIVFLRGSQTELLAALFSECKNSSQDVWDELCNTTRAPWVLSFLLVAAVLKLLMTAVVFGARVPAGIFIPSLATGALIGRMVGFAMELLQAQVGDSGFFSSCVSTTRCITPGIYAIVGAAAVLGGVTRMTVSLVVIMFELTGGLEYILPVMVAVIISKWVGDAFGRDGIYDEHITLNGYPYLDNKADFSFAERASDVMSSASLCCISLHGNTMRSLEELLEAQPYQGFPVVTSQDEMLVVGYIARPMLGRVLQRARERSGVGDDTRCTFTAGAPAPRDASFVDLSPWLDQSPIQIVETTPLDRVIEMFRALGLRHVLVTRHGQLVGIIKKKDILEHIQIFHQRDIRSRMDSTV